VQNRSRGRQQRSQQTLSDRKKLDDLKERVPIDLVLEVFGYPPADYWQSSGWRAATCPFHEDSRPSAGISPESDYFHCFGCGWKGDVITLVMVVQNKSFPEAITWLEELVPPSDTTTNW
jgi:DNA primase